MTQRKVEWCDRLQNCRTRNRKPDNGYLADRYKKNYSIRVSAGYDDEREMSCLPADKLAITGAEQPVGSDYVGVSSSRFIKTYQLPNGSGLVYGWCTFSPAFPVDLCQEQA